MQSWLAFVLHSGSSQGVGNNLGSEQKDKTMAKARITIPVQPRVLIKLCIDVETEHKEQGKDSPLSILDWEKISPTIKEADEVDSKIASLNRELEKLAERRRTLIETPGGLSDFARQARDILSGVHRNEIRKLGDYGFDVNDSPKAKRVTEKKLAAAA